MGMRVFERLRVRWAMCVPHRTDETTPTRIEAALEAPVAPVAGDASLSGLQMRKVLSPEIATLVPGI